MTAVRVVLAPVEPPLRIDRALVAALAEAGHACTRSQLAKAFGDRQVTIDGRPIKPSARVELPCTVEVVLPQPEPLRAEPEDLPLCVLHEDDDVLVVNKAAGMVVHPGPGHPGGTLVNAVLFHLGIDADGLPVLPGNDATRPGIVHRLDKDTSGVLIIAKHMRAQECLAAQFREHDLRRRYVGIVDGVVSWNRRRVETGHGRDPNHRVRFAPRDDATRRAVSDVAVAERLAGATVLRFTLHTGRTHQIRMHARHLGYPILADALYGRPARDARVRAAEATLRSHALHAQLLELQHPGGETMRWEAPLPDELSRVIDALR